MNSNLSVNAKAFVPSSSVAPFKPAQTQLKDIMLDTQKTPRHEKKHQPRRSGRGDKLGGSALASSSTIKKQ
eukprot:CAMPEP_0174714256 /NCGR_PEP_ID=MMETSP1094-20130205/17521_1 /TAXON_ID=156173 /ORGANISM="Chrysochromulina brevifilum, Strain UTEX LB 985" /LENGTH=70 /DNA_ID=CAMNT_0015913581 /DNA_START=58 /DNA_END=267 /DNA_ORIENTATION=-